MSEDKRKRDAMVEELKQMRDELRVKLKLAAADARDEWDVLEKKWEHLEGRLGVVGKEAGAVAENVGDALELAVDELRKGYERIKKLV